MAYAPKYAAAPLGQEEREVLQNVKEALPKRLQGLRACRYCKRLKTYNQFEDEGCECRQEGFLAEEDTTADFEGFLAITDPDNSYFAKTQGITVPGCYALAIHSVGGPRDEGEEEDTLDTDEEGES